MTIDANRLAGILQTHEAELLAEWMKEQLAATTRRADLINERDLREQSRQLLAGIRGAAAKGNLTDVTTPEWGPVRDLLEEVSRTRAQQGFSPSETATFVFSLKQPLFARLRQGVRDAGELAAELWAATVLLDKLGLYTIEVFQKSREDVIGRQQQELLELSTPVVQLWDGILALPLIGTLDSARTQVVMESLLQRIVETGAPIAIIDITGVPTVDTLVAQHLLKTVAAARLMGADCIISGIRPQIAQTIVHLGVDLGDGGHQGHAGRRLRGGAPAHGQEPRAAGRGLRRDGGAHPDPEDGRVPPGDDPGGHARPPGHDAPGRPHRAHRRRPGRTACSSTSRRSRSWTRSSGGCSGTSRRWRGSSTPRPSSSACGRRSRSRWSSWGCPSGRPHRAERGEGHGPPAGRAQR